MPEKLFCVETLHDDEVHISVGLSPESLCGRNDICETIQIQKIDDYGIPQPSCDECIKRFKENKQDKHFEPTIICEICDISYSAPRSRVVTTETNPSSKICKICYEKLLKEENNVDIPYKEAEPAY